MSAANPSKGAALQSHLSSPLLDLPAEIRLMIFKCLGTDCVLVIDEKRKFVVQSPCPALTKICSLLRNEAISLHFSNLKLVIEFRKSLDRFKLAIPPIYQRHIREVEQPMECGTYWYSPKVYPRLKLLVFWAGDALDRFPSPDSIIDDYGETSAWATALGFWKQKKGYLNRIHKKLDGDSKDPVLATLIWPVIEPPFYNLVGENNFQFQAILLTGHRQFQSMTYDINKRQALQVVWK